MKSRIFSDYLPEATIRSRNSRYAALMITDIYGMSEAASTSCISTHVIITLLFHDGIKGLAVRIRK